MRIVESTPRLLIEITLEGEPALRLVTLAAEDEECLRAWASRSTVVRQLGLHVLDVLDRIDRRAA